MTYSENLVQLILDVVNYHGTQAEMIKIAEEALRAQREACAMAGRKATLGKLQTHYPPKKTQEPYIIAIVQSCMADEIGEAILNAEVKL
jgi:hypothetical protein